MFRATPAYVISGVEERWHHVRHMPSLHITAERVVTPKPSAHMAKAMIATYDYDTRMNLSDPVQQKYFLLLNAFEHARAAPLACNPDLGPDDFAVVVEDDVSLHNRLSLRTRARPSSTASTWRAPTAWCHDASAQVHGAVAFSRCCGLGSYPLAFTKRRAATFVADMHASVKHRLANDPGFDATYAQSVN